MTAPILLNLGSGPLAPDGWISFDASWNAWLAQRPALRRLARVLGIVTAHHDAIDWPRQGLVCHDVRRGLPYATASVDGIYAAHFLEHLEPEEAAGLLTECHRVLRCGGALRVIVPDLEALIADYRRAAESPVAPHEAAGRFLSSLNLAALRRWPAGTAWSIARLFSHAGHRAVHDRRSMRHLLEQAGFCQLEERGPLESRIPLLSLVETAAKHEASLCLEAVKS